MFNELCESILASKSILMEGRYDPWTGLPYDYKLVDGWELSLKAVDDAAKDALFNRLEQNKKYLLQKKKKGMDENDIVKPITMAVLKELTNNLYENLPTNYDRIHMYISRYLKIHFDNMSSTQADNDGKKILRFLDNNKLIVKNPGYNDEDEDLEKAAGDESAIKAYEVKELGSDRSKFRASDREAGSKPLSFTDMRKLGINIDRSNSSMRDY